MATRPNSVYAQVRAAESAVARHRLYSGDWLLELALVVAIVAAVVSAAFALNGAGL